MGNVNTSDVHVPGDERTLRKAAEILAAVNAGGGTVGDSTTEENSEELSVNQNILSMLSHLEHLERRVEEGADGEKPPMTFDVKMTLSDMRDLHRILNPKRRTLAKFAKALMAKRAEVDMIEKLQDSKLGEDVKKFIETEFMPRQTSKLKALTTAVRGVMLLRKSCVHSPMEPRETALLPVDEITDLDANLDVDADGSVVTDDSQRLGRRFTRIDTLHAELAAHCEGKISDWDFDIFSVLAFQPTMPLKFVVLTIVQRSQIHTRLGIDVEKIANFAGALEAGYHNDNPYHNSLHGADVAQTMYYFMSSTGIGGHLDDVEIFASILAAAAHDVGHPAVNNNFLIATGDQLALTYNDVSPLENMHSATTWHLLSDETNNVFSGMKKSARERSRAQMISMILATDNASHTVLLDQLKDAVAGTEKDWSWTSGKTLKLVLDMAMHAADVSNPCKSLEPYKRWVERIMQEFYGQAARERAGAFDTGMAALDASSPVPDEIFQMGFIVHAVMPLYETFAACPGINLSECMAQLELNTEHWKSLCQKKEEEKQPSQEEDVALERLPSKIEIKTP